MWRNALVAATSLCLVVTLAAGVQTTRADFRDETDTRSLFAAGTVSVGVGGGRLAIDVSGLEPTMTVEDCVEIAYDGDLEPVEVRLFSGSLRSGGLEDFLLVRIEEGERAPGGRCDGFTPSRVVFDDTAGRLLARHRDATSAFSTWTASATGDSLAYRVRIRVMDDNAAQGLSTGFEIIAEAAP